MTCFDLRLALHVMQDSPYRLAFGLGEARGVSQRSLRRRARNEPTHGGRDDHAIIDLVITSWEPAGAFISLPTGPQRAGRPNTVPYSRIFLLP